MKLAPTTAILCTADDSGAVVAEEELPAALIQVGGWVGVVRCGAARWVDWGGT